MEKRYLSRAREREETNERKLKIPSTFEAVTWFVYDVHTQDWRMKKKYYNYGILSWMCTRNKDKVCHLTQNKPICIKSSSQSLGKFSVIHDGFLIARNFSGSIECKNWGSVKLDW